VTFYRTVPMDAQPLREAIEQAKRQEDAIHAIFLRFPHLKLAPSQVHELVTKAGKRWPITSIRRAITDLEHADVLTKTRTLHIGPHGRFEYRWQLATTVEQTMPQTCAIAGA
jgi:hypothetical protein